MYQPIFKENYRGKGAWARAGAVFNRLGRFCNNINGSGGIIITPNAHGGLDISGGGGGSGMNLSMFAFGWKGTSGKAVNIAVGYVEGRYGFRLVGETVVHVGGNVTNKHLIVATGNESSASVETNSVLESAYNGDTANQWRRILYRVYLNDNGSPVMDMIGVGVGGIVL